MKKNIVFLPCRKGSERIPNKNTRIFAGISGGLLTLKLKQLLGCKYVDKIYLSSNDEAVLDIGRSMSDNRILLDRRPDFLCLSTTSTDELLDYVPCIIKEDATIMWAHVTSPFINSQSYDNMFKTYYANLHKYDSLMTVNKLRTFIWNEFDSINYDRVIEKWPRTQTLEPLYEINSGAFIADKSVYVKCHDRIGEHVFLYPTTKVESLDIDWPEDFDLAEVIYKSILKNECR